MSGRDRRVEIALPAWLDDEPVVLGSRQDRMRHVVALARRNVREGTGGPFGAAVVRADSGEVLGVGVNLVVTARNSTAHAENRLEDQDKVKRLVFEQRESVSGVSLDEEMAELVKYQRAFDASAHVMRVIDEMLETVVNGLLR